jgi:peptidoglycan lytic transglycosylase G
MTHILSLLLKFVLFGVAIAVMAGSAWLIYTSPDSISRHGVRLDNPSDETPILVVVESGDTAADIGVRLESAGVIDSGGSFERLARIVGAESSLVAGEYEFVAGTSVLDALTRVRDGLTSSRIVTFREGMRVEEIAEVLEARGVVSAADFLAAADGISTNGADAGEGLLASRPPESTLEGYLYPATYSFPRSIDANEAVQMMIEALSTRLTPELRAEAQARGLTIHQVLVLASIVEREAVLPEERSLIASVYLNRLNEAMPLQADPTVQYALTERPGSVEEFGYWKRGLSLEDLQFASTYNTYVQTGLPPGPIANPGIESITAVIRPAQTDYLFFVATGDGSHVFATTYEEHLANVQRYQPSQ